MNRIKKGDNVMVISGKNKYKQGTVLRVFPKDDTAIVEGLNIVKRHQKKDHAHENSAIIQKEAPIRLCKLAIIEQKGKEKGTPTKVKFIMKDNKKIRVSKKSNAEIGAK